MTAKGNEGSIHRMCVLTIMLEQYPFGKLREKKKDFMK